MCGNKYTNHPNLLLFLFNDACVSVSISHCGINRSLCSVLLIQIRMDADPWKYFLHIYLGQTFQLSSVCLWITDSFLSLFLLVVQMQCLEGNECTPLSLSLGPCFPGRLDRNITNTVTIWIQVPICFSPLKEKAGITKKKKKEYLFSIAYLFCCAHLVLEKKTNKCQRANIELEDTSESKYRQVGSYLIGNLLYFWWLNPNKCTLANCYTLYVGALRFNTGVHLSFKNMQKEESYFSTKKWQMSTLTCKSRKKI